MRKVQMKKSKNSELLQDFMAYCIKNKNERFWQALRNWARVSAIWVSKEVHTDEMTSDKIYDTFYWEHKNK
jgi:hypothetical protein